LSTAGNVIVDSIMKMVAMIMHKDGMIRGSFYLHVDLGIGMNSNEPFLQIKDRF